MRDLRAHDVSCAAEAPLVSRFPALSRMRIGCVQYLNARPLVHAYDGPVLFRHPAQLACDIASDRLDAALVPVFEALGAKRYSIVEGAAIASDGPVYSVFLAYQGDLSAVRAAAIDPASLTSVNLLKVIMAEFRAQPLQYVAASPLDATRARLLIGNQAIEFRAAAPAGWSYLDLGEEWTARTGLPFVYAVWMLRSGIPDLRSAAAEFRSLKTQGVAQIPEIVRGEKIGSPEFRLKYLTQHIRYDLGSREKLGLEQFRKLLARHGLIPKAAPTLKYI